VERLFDPKILTMQTDWDGEYHKLHPFFEKLASPTMSLVLMPTNKMGLLNASTVT
jgi:hypothetical protein